MAPKCSTQSSQTRLICMNTPLLATMTRCPFSIPGRLPNKGAASTGHVLCSASSRGSVISFRSAVEQLPQCRARRHQHVLGEVRELAVQHVFPELVRTAAILHEVLADVRLREERSEERLVPRVDFLGGCTLGYTDAALADAAVFVHVEVRRLK